MQVRTVLAALTRRIIALYPKLSYE